MFAGHNIDRLISCVHLVNTYMVILVSAWRGIALYLGGSDSDRVYGTTLILESKYTFQTRANNMGSKKNVYVT